MGGVSLLVTQSLKQAWNPGPGRMLPCNETDIDYPRYPLREFTPCAPGRSPSAPGRSPSAFCVMRETADNADGADTMGRGGGCNMTARDATAQAGVEPRTLARAPIQ